jgi:hypothetical protein
VVTKFIYSSIDYQSPDREDLFEKVNVYPEDYFVTDKNDSFKILMEDGSLDSWDEMEIEIIPSDQLTQLLDNNEHDLFGVLEFSETRSRITKKLTNNKLDFVISKNDCYGKGEIILKVGKNDESNIEMQYVFPWTIKFDIGLDETSSDIIFNFRDFKNSELEMYKEYNQKPGAIFDLYHIGSGSPVLYIDSNVAGLEKFINETKHQGKNRAIQQLLFGFIASNVMSIVAFIDTIYAYNTFNTQTIPTDIISNYTESVEEEGLLSRAQHIFHHNIQDAKENFSEFLKGVFSGDNIQNSNIFRLMFLDIQDKINLRQTVGLLVGVDK